MTGAASRVSASESVCPPSTMPAVAWFFSAPIPLESISGTIPATKASVVMRIGRSRSRFASRIASTMGMPRARSWLV